MFGKITMLIAFLILFHTMFFCIDTTYAVELYVACGGSDANDGSISKPFATLERARNEIRSLRRTVDVSKTGVTVFIRGGIYDLIRGLEISKQDSGYEGAPIVYQAFPGEDVRLTGGKQMKSFKKIEDAAILKRLPKSSIGKVVAIDVRGCGINDFGELKHRGMGQPVRVAGMELFFNGKPMELARWPNDGFVLTGEVIDTGSRMISRGSVAGWKRQPKIDHLS